MHIKDFSRIKGNARSCTTRNGISVPPELRMLGSKGPSQPSVYATPCMSEALFLLLSSFDTCVISTSNPWAEKAGEGTPTAPTAPSTRPRQLCPYHTDETLCFSVPEHQNYSVHLHTTADQHNSRNSINTKCVCKD